VLQYKSQQLAEPSVLQLAQASVELAWEELASVVLASVVMASVVLASFLEATLLDSLLTLATATARVQE